MPKKIGSQCSVVYCVVQNYQGTWESTMEGQNSAIKLVIVAYGITIVGQSSQIANQLAKYLHASPPWWPWHHPLITLVWFFC